MRLHPSYILCCKGEDIDICSELLQETLESLRSLPEALLFNEDKISSVWIDILEKSSIFLRQVVLGYGPEQNVSHPLKKLCRMYSFFRLQRSDK
jgi:hypothetical protein